MFIIKPGVDLMDLLKRSGYSSYRIAHEKIFGQSILTKFRKGGLPSWQELYRICMLCHVAPIDVIAIQLDNGAIFDLSGKVRLDMPTHTPQYDDDIPPVIPPEYIR